MLATLWQNHPMYAVLLNKRSWLFLLGLLMLFMSCVMVIFVNHQCRIFYASLQAVQRQQQQAKKTQSQLLLEQGSLLAELRIERLARQMGFVKPDKIEVFNR